MKPIEELQAAHKQLSDMRTWAQPAPWNHDSGYVLRDGNKRVIGSSLGTRNVDLIVALHRSIDAQLALLAEAARYLSAPSSDPSVVAAELQLARLISGVDHD